MVYRKEDRIAFMLVPRTGSTSLRESLVANGFKYPIVFSNTDYGFAWHATYRQSVEAFPSLLNYRIYGVFRDPIDRFASGLRYAAESLAMPTKTEADYDALIQKLFGWKPEAEGKGVLGEIFKKQVDWLDGPNVTVIGYDNAAARIAEVVGLTEPMAKMNASTRLSSLSAKAVDFAKVRYAADYNFADSFRLAA
jgi:hypothetical protein